MANPKSLTIKVLEALKDKYKAALDIALDGYGMLDREGSNELEIWGFEDSLEVKTPLVLNDEILTPGEALTVMDVLGAICVCPSGYKVHYVEGCVEYEPVYEFAIAGDPPLHKLKLDSIPSLSLKAEPTFPLKA